MRISMNVFIVTNSPGELMGWVKPVVQKLKDKEPRAKIIVVIPPCQYSSGMEKKVAKSFPEVKSIIGAAEYIKYILSGISPISIRKIKRGVVVFLGGDPVYTVLLSKRLSLPAIAYIQKPRWRKYFKKFMVLNQKTQKEFLRQGIKVDRILIVGDLVTDTVQVQISKDEIYKHWHLDPQRPIISIMPGSRPSHTKYTTPFFLRVIELIKDEFPEAQFFLILSPFANKENLISLGKEKLNRVFQGTTAKLIKEGEQWKLLTEMGLKVSLVEKERYEIMSVSNIAITIPGTNTAELAFLGIPMVVAVPLNKPEAIPLDGLSGLIDKFPLLGTLIKRWIVKKYNKKIKFTAIPNIRAEEEIVPEVRGIIEAQDVAKQVIKILREPTRRDLISGKLKKVMGTKGASDRVVEVILNEISPTRGKSKE